MTRFEIEGPPVIHQTLDGEVIIVNLDTGTYYRLEGAAAEVWTALEEGAPVEPGPFLRRLADERLIRLVEGELPEAAGEAAPGFEKYTDMHELLLLDPIHEVDERGWPNRAGDAA